MSEFGKSWLIFLKAGEYTDVTFFVGEHELPIKCHRLVLIARAPAVFAPMFSERWNEHHEKGEEFVIKIPDVQPEAFQKFLEYIYGEAFEMTGGASLAVDVLYVAKKYLVDSLAGECVKYLTKKQTIDEAVKVLLKVQGGLSEALEATGSVLVKNFARLLGHHDLGRLEESHWIYLLHRKDLVLKEYKIFEIIYEWACAKLLKTKEAGDTDVTLQGLLRNILPLIHFPAMSAAEFVDSVVPLDVLDQQVALHVLCYMNTAGDDSRFGRKLPFPTDPRC